jgi:hypothetical protein
MLGFLLAGIVSDWSAKILTRKNKGIYEPEFRMIIVIPQMIVGCAGLYGFGITANKVGKYGWFWPDFFLALEVMGMVLGAVASALYIVDAHRESYPYLGGMLSAERKIATSLTSQQERSPWKGSRAS